MRRMVVVGLVGAAVVATAVVVARRTPASTLIGEPDWAPLTLAGPAPAAAPTAAVHPAPTSSPLEPRAAWVAPDTAGECPGSHPIKTNRSSRIFHRPGGQSYARTKAERCYCDEPAAEADGYRAAKR